MREMDRVAMMDAGCERMVQAARSHGLTQADEPRFCMWVANEVYEKREVANFDVLAARARELVLMFNATEKK